MSWRHYIKPSPEDLRVQRVQSPPEIPLPTLKTLPTLEIGIEDIPVLPLPQWQQELCFAHGEFNCWRGSCPKSLDDCLVSKIIDCEGVINRLAQYELGHGITCGDVIEYCSNDDSEPLDVLLTKPLSFICVAESLLKQRKKSSVINFFEHQHEETASDKRNS